MRAPCRGRRGPLLGDRRPQLERCRHRIDTQFVAELLATDGELPERERTLSCLGIALHQLSVDVLLETVETEQLPPDLDRQIVSPLGPTAMLDGLHRAHPEKEQPLAFEETPIAEAPREEVPTVQIEASPENGRPRGRRQVHGHAGSSGLLEGLHVEPIRGGVVERQIGVLDSDVRRTAVRCDAKRSVQAPQLGREAVAGASGRSARPQLFGDGAALGCTTCV